MASKIKQVKKRDGRIVDFNQEKITIAISKAMQATGEGNLDKDPIRVSDRVVKDLEKRCPPGHIPEIEEIQDLVEEKLIVMDFPKTAKHYILYRQKRAEIREKRKQIPEQIKKLVQESKKYFPNALGEFIYYRTYSRWLPEERRRETWVETVDRYINFMRENLGSRLKEEEYQEIKKAILNQEVMPSMRLMWSAGRAAKATNVSVYNCSYIAPNKLTDFGEIMYLLMCGAGVGFSVENQNVQRLPIIKHQTGKVLPTHIIGDSKEGWGDALTLGLKTWYKGQDIKFDYSKLRPAGARLKTMGGRSSGPEPLRSLLDFVRKKVLDNQGRRLSSIDVHDIICKIGELVVMGGVRRCLPQNTLVHTKNGLIPIKDIHPGDKVLTRKGTYKKVIAVEYTGKRKVVNIHTQLGIFQSTPEHRWATLSDLDGNIRWVKASDLTSSDTLIHIPDIIPGRKTSLPPYRYKKPKYSTTSKDITIPNLDEEIAWLLGYFHGDGYVYHKKDTYGELMFACSPDMPETVERIKRSLERFGVNVSVRKGKKDKALRVRVKSNQLANYFYQFKKPKESITIPDFILKGIPEIRAAYIAGVFDADGSIKSRNGKKVRPSISSIYPDWLRQLRAVLASIGISSCIKQNRPTKGNWKALFRLATVSIESLYKFADSIGMRSEKWKKDASGIERKKEQNSFIIPKNLLASSEYKTYFDSAYYSASSKTLVSFSTFEQILVNNLVAKRRHYRPVTIKKITDGGLKDTYDIQVEGDECFVAEGMLVHNSALISLSDLEDEKMRKAKTGYYYITNPQRSMANNSAVYNKKPTAIQFMEEWLALAQSGTGERGIFNRGGLRKQLPERRWKTFKKYWQTSGTNPCGEVTLRSHEFCNLTEVVARPEDTEETLLRKIRTATILGTYQTTLTNFPYISKEWKRNCEEERLLGVSITGQWDCPTVRKPNVLRKLRQKVLEVNREYAKRFGINPATAATSVKPSGNVSQLVNSASGMHPRYAPYYIRRVRISAQDPLFHMLKEQKFPYHPEVGQAEASATTYVLEFPVKAPEGSVFRKDLSALQQLEYWKRVKENYTEHNPSQTIFVGENEWIKVAHWLYENWEILGGLTFLPREEHLYRLAPFEEITEEKYKQLVSRLPEIDFSQILIYEKEDETVGPSACEGITCEPGPEEK